MWCLELSIDLSPDLPSSQGLIFHNWFSTVTVYVIGNVAAALILCYLPMEPVYLAYVIIFYSKWM